MIIQIEAPGVATVSLAGGERFCYAKTYQAGGPFGMRVVPPFPFSSPIARLLHGRYVLAEVIAPASGAVILLHETQPLNQFHVVRLDKDQHAFINCAHLVGFSFDAGGGIGTQLHRFISPACWIIGHPLPVVAHGPGSVLLSGCRLVEEHGRLDILSRQIVTFDAAARWTVCAPASDARLFSRIWNVLSSQCRILFLDEAIVLRSQVMPTSVTHMRMVRFLLHLGILGLIALLLRH